MKPINALLSPAHRATERDLRLQVRVLVALCCFLLGVALYASWGCSVLARQVQVLENLITVHIE